MSEFKIGPLQEKWLQALEQHPELQTTGTLGKKTNEESPKYCCLGMAEVILCEAAGNTPQWEEYGNAYRLSSEGSTAVLGNYHKLGLKDAWGNFIDNFYWHGENTLASINDSGKTWPEIAAFIRANPEKVFTHPV